MLHEILDGNSDDANFSYGEQLQCRDTVWNQVGKVGLGMYPNCITVSSNTFPFLMSFAAAALPSKRSTT